MSILIYDPLLDDFEPGLKTADVISIFNELRPEQIKLIHQISEKNQVKDSFLRSSYSEKEQWDFTVHVLQELGFDWNRGRLDKTAHPFTTSFSIDDVRIANRVSSDYLPTCFFGAMHEGGHALYAQGIDIGLERTPLAGGCSLAFHESQSRMVENIIGRSYEFWAYCYPKLQRTFPTHLKNVSLKDFYRGINKVAPGTIRVESDEATYNLHIMLRVEIELGMVEGALEVKDLPEVWNSKMNEYLGITPQNDREGVLQDVHWSLGALGYFATYALGNLISAQLWNKMNESLPKVSDDIKHGDFGSMMNWLKNNVHQHGAKYQPQELITRITGSKIEHKHYLTYLRNKYSDIYSL